MRSLAGCLVSLTVFLVTVVTHTTAAAGKLRGVNQGEGVPCYVVISDEIREGSHQREIRILMDKDDVNEMNFVNLQRHFCEKYRDVRQLSVQVNTSLDFTLGNYKTVDIERQQAGLSPKPKVWERGAQGILTCTRELEEFGYKADGGDMKDMKYVVVRGEDPYCKDCKRLGASLPGAESTTGLGRKTRDGTPCYFEIGDYVVDRTRYIGVFISSEDGNEGSLLGLLRHFSQQFPEPEPLVIKVYTNFKQRNDFITAMLSVYSFVPAMREYFVAVVFRDTGNEVIRYRRPHGKVRTVVVRGVDIYPNLDGR